MKKEYLNNSDKLKLVKFISVGDYKSAIGMLDNISTPFTGAARMTDKRFTIAEIVRHIVEKKLEKSVEEKEFFAVGNKILNFNSVNAREIGVNIIWRAYKFDKKKVSELILNSADDPNWEVREYAAGAIAATVYAFPEFLKTVEKWRKHKSENVRRGVIFAAWSMRNKKDPSCTAKAFALLDPLLYDSSKYVKKNLGPFAIGSWYGNAFPEQTLKQLGKWVKLKDENVRWNVAMAFNNSFGNHYPEEALKILEILLPDQRPVVRRAVISTLRTLRKRHSRLISAFLDKHKIEI